MGMPDECFPYFPLKDDRFVMVRSKGNVRNVGTPCRYYMELRSMSRRPPPYNHVDTQGSMNLHDDPSTRNINVIDRNRVEEKDGAPPVAIKDDCAIYPRCRYLAYCIGGMFVFFLCVILISLVFPYPMHASCMVKWKFGDPCTYSMQKLRSQILNWSSCFNCGRRGSKCLYTLKEPKSHESDMIRAVHLGPNLQTVESIKITFEEVNKTCVATGESVSNEWFRIFDYGTNYCNLRNLVSGIGFDKSPKFLELTTNAVCTQYNMAICD